MVFPTDMPVIDTMAGFPVPVENTKAHYAEFATRDRESREEFDFPVEYMFHNIPRPVETDDLGAAMISEMDRFNIQAAVIGGDENDPRVPRAFADYPKRFLNGVLLRPHDGMECVREIERRYHESDARVAHVFAAGENPQVPINDKRYYPLYAKCAELGIPVFICAGTPGPRVPGACQKVELLDEIAWYFPELTIVTRHGCMPDVDLAVQLLLKWPNLYYSTSAMAPKYWPKQIIDFANTRGADKVIFAGYFPMGLSYDRIFAELADVAFKDHVWPKFLYENAQRVLGLDTPGEI